MADGYLETHQQEYEARKAAWLRKKSALPGQQKRHIEKARRRHYEIIL